MLSISACEKVLLAALVVLAASATLVARTPADPVPSEAAPDPGEAVGIKVLHLGNEGFLVEGGGKKILVDAVQGRGIRGYVTLPATRRQTMQKALPPFDGVDLILATHRHDDHFDPWAVGRLLQASPETRFFSTSQSVERLEAEFPDYEKIKERTRGIDPVEGRPIRLEHSGISVTILDLHHGRGSDVDNLGFVFQVGGLRILHVGDTAATPEEFAQYDLVAMRIDLAMLPFWIVSGDDWPRYEATLGARHVLAMHIPAPDAPARYFGHGKTTQASYVDWLRDRRPDVTLFWKPFQERRYNVGDSPRD